MVAVLVEAQSVHPMADFGVVTATTSLAAPMAVVLAVLRLVDPSMDPVVERSHPQVLSHPLNKKLSTFRHTAFCNLDNTSSPNLNTVLLLNEF
jgi:hypothetical protein